MGNTMGFNPSKLGIGNLLGFNPSYKELKIKNDGIPFTKIMGQSLVQNYIHIIFSTKNRIPMIVPPFEQELHAYIGSVCNNMECQVLKVGGFTDHIHILCMLSKKVALVTLLQEVKAHSSKWMKTKSELLDGFYWQDGYGAFSVSPTHVDSVIEYIANQHKHHSDNSFKEEYLTLLQKSKIDYDEKYLWD